MMKLSTVAIVAILVLTTTLPVESTFGRICRVAVSEKRYVDKIDCFQLYVLCSFDFDLIDLFYSSIKADTIMCCSCSLRYIMIPVLSISFLSVMGGRGKEGFVFCTLLFLFGLFRNVGFRKAMNSLSHSYHSLLFQ